MVSKKSQNLVTSTRRSFVTGASGFVGMHLVDALLKNGDEVGVYGRNINQSYIETDKVEKFTGDITDFHTLTKAIDTFRPHYIFHLAADLSKSPSLVDVSRSHNVIGMLHILETIVALEKNVDLHIRLVTLGTLDEVVGNELVPITEVGHEIPISSYGYSKLLATKAVEYYIRTQGLSAAVLRPSIIYGPGQRDGMFIPSCISTLCKGEKFEMSSGVQERDWVYISDVIKAILLVANKNDFSGIINIASGTPISLSHVADMLMSAVGSGEVNKGTLGIRLGEPMRHQISIDKAKEVLNWAPQTMIKEGIYETVKWHRTKQELRGGIMK